MLMQGEYITMRLLEVCRGNYRHEWHKSLGEPSEALA